MKALLILPLLLTSCHAARGSEPVDWAQLIILFYLALLLWSIRAAGYYEGLAKGRKAHIHELREECNYARRMAEQEATGIVPEGEVE